jgi:prevent-host-death family protein
MSDRLVQASVFKARCLAMLDTVAHERISIVITKHGKPVARVVPIEASRPTLGSVMLMADDDAYYSTGEHWDADA